MPDYNQEASQQEYVYLIHGTQPNGPRPEEADWWQRHSVFAKHLAEALGPRFKFTDWKTDAIRKDYFTWLGSNSEYQRRLAGEQLLGWLESLEEHGPDYHLIAHSHGGSVIWNALKLAEQKKVKLGRLRSWTTVGTPFLGYGLTSLYPFLIVTFGIIAVASFPVMSRGIAGASNFDTFHGLSFAAALLCAVLLFGCASMSGAFLIYASLWTWRSYRLKGERRAEDQAAEQYGKSHFALWHANDEPILGLGATLARPADIAPRAHRVPRSIDKATGTTPIEAKGPSLFGRLYDSAIAPVADQFVWRLLMKRLQGSDVSGLSCRTVDTIPHAKMRRWPAMASPALDQLDDFTGSAARRTFAGFRARLLDIRTSGDGRLLLDSMPRDMWNSIIHMSYFDVPTTTTLISAHIKQHSDLAMADEPDAARPTEEKAEDSDVAARSFRPYRLWAAASAASLAGYILLVFAFSLSFDAFVWPLGYPYQLRAVVSRVNEPSFLAYRDNDYVGYIFGDLKALNLLGKPGPLLDTIVDASLAVSSAQVLAFSAGHDGHWKDVQELSNYSRNLAIGVENWERVKATILLQGLAGVIVSGQLPKPEQIDEAVAATNKAGASGQQFGFLSTSVLLTANPAIDLDKLPGFGEHFCEKTADNTHRERPSDRWGAVAYDQCMKSHPDAFERYGVPLEETVSGRPPDDPSGLLFVEAAGWKDIIEKKPVEARRLLLLKMHERKPTSEQELSALWDIASMFSSKGDTQTTSDIASAISKVEADQDTHFWKDDLERMKLKTLEMLRKFGLNDEASAFVDHVERHARTLPASSPLYTKVDQLRVVAALNLELQRSDRSRALLIDAADLILPKTTVGGFGSRGAVRRTTQRSDRETIALFDPLIALAKAATDIDNATAGRLLAYAIQSASLDARPEPRAVKFAVLARRWTEIGRLADAREASERAGMATAENQFSDDGDVEDAIYGSKEVDAGGTIGAYLAILDAIVAKSAGPAADRLAVGRTKRIQAPPTVSLTGSGD
ncbi:hypothetical protein [Bradyrhizobium sp. S3.5.5]|uniref:hypothetical protein n=1 Tax=Bradyrhizobium sp. S3.5.5 TaxID=3156430 RepID=UPI00339A1C57